MPPHVGFSYCPPCCCNELQQFPWHLEQQASLLLQAFTGNVRALWILFILIVGPALEGSETTQALSWVSWKRSSVSYSMLVSVSASLTL